MPFPLHGKLISGPAFESWLHSHVGRHSGELALCSAFFRSEALDRLFANANEASGRVLVRWQLGDLVAGASDLELFNSCQRLGLRLHLRLDFHAKVYAVVPFGIGVGSANATARGFGYGPLANSELCTLVEASPANLAVVEDLFRGATLVDQNVFDRLSEVFERSTSAGEQLLWPEDVMELLRPSPAPTTLLVDECFHGDASCWNTTEAVGSAPLCEHDLQLLGIDSSSSLEEVQRALRRSRMFRWLVLQLEQAPNGELYFGSLSALLHSSLLDDPAPGRRDVKGLLQNLVSWLRGANLQDVKVDRPSHSQRLKLVR